MDERQTFLKQAIETLGLKPEEAQIRKLLDYYEMILEKNKVMNLTRITDYEEMVWKHMVDSLSLVKTAAVRHGMKILDLGSGAGFPGIPVSIMFPDAEVLMVDSVGKKVDFITDVTEKLELSRASAAHARAENLARDKKHREKYDLCLSRAVANLTTLSEYCLPFVRVGGMWIAYKGPECQKELEEAAYAVRILGGKEPELQSFRINEMDRVLVRVKKIKKTPMQYPRKAGMPSKEPLREK